MYERTELLLGKKNLQKLKNAKVIIFGVGGVGGYVAEMLVRTGIGNITIVDGDFVTKSNLNRQIIALNSTIGKPKVEVMKERLLDINKDLKVKALHKIFDKTNEQEFDIENYDYIVDAIDSLHQKFALIIYAKAKGVNIISSMGSGNRSGLPTFKIGDIFETTYDGLARKLRDMLKKSGVKNLTVAYTDEEPKKQKPTASVVYYPATCGILIASYVINELIKE
jgi:tRNA threonylcarbamoyladenosine dehydratase